MKENEYRELVRKAQSFHPWEMTPARREIIQRGIDAARNGDPITPDALRALANAGDYNTAPQLRAAADRIEAQDELADALLADNVRLTAQRDEAVAVLREIAYPDPPIKDADGAAGQQYVDEITARAFLSRQDKENQ